MGAFNVASVGDGPFHGQRVGALDFLALGLSFVAT